MTTSTQAPAGGVLDGRKRWMRVLAMASTDQLARAWEQWDAKPQVRAIRGPEAGLVMLRGRIGGQGERFNLGEATVVRATLHLHGQPLRTETVGSAYVLGTDLEHAWYAAAFDGLLADDQQRPRVLDAVIRPLENEQRERDDADQADALSTKVDFFTVAREHE